LIGGVVVPLIVSQGVNGKVSFLEKHGTGEANGTGAYELDLSLVGNYKLAWREMTGLQSDVFCAAGLTLPDKAGRQLTAGGWAGESNYGVRLYLPGKLIPKPNYVKSLEQDNAEAFSCNLGLYSANLLD
jgi:hypothetical protein